MKNIKLSLCTLFISLTTIASAFGAEWLVKSGEKIQNAVKKAQPGDTILVEPGEYKQTVYIDKENITLKGLKVGDKYAVLNGEFILNDGIIASGHGVVIEGFWVKGYKGNAIMTQGANNFKILNNIVDGAFYGIFPQFGKNGLVKGNTVFNSEDAGIYVGMSDHIDVVENIAYENVMGLEFENSRHSLMARNQVYNNTAGIVLSIVPGLPVKDSYDLVIKDNVVRDNNLKNFAPASSVAAGVPQGVGIMIFGPDNVTIENNTIENNNNAGMFVIDTVSFGMSSDPEVDPYIDDLKVLKNTWKNNGNAISGFVADTLARSGKSGLEVISIGKGKNNCILPQEGIDSIGTKRWGNCDNSSSKADMKTARLAKPVESPKYTKKQKGRLTYLAVCTGCHAYDSVLHGPSMESIQALYQNDVKGLINYIIKPEKKRSGFPEMPPQGYLGEEALQGISNYILNELGK